MFRHIVVGADGGQRGEDAVALGATIAASTGSELTLLRCLDPSLPCPSDPDRSPRLRKAERELERARSRWAPEAHIELESAGNPAEALCACAERCDADLVVIGSARHAAPGRCVIGRTGRHLLDVMPTALVIASRGLSEHEPHLSRVAVGYDGGPGSERAWQMADRLATAAGAELRIETIYELPAATPGADAPSPQAAQDRAPDQDPLASERRGALEVAEHAVARSSPRSRLHVRVGEPGPELRRVSRGVDLTVIGSRRCGPADRIALGAAGEALVSDCGSSLLITPNQEARSLVPAG